MKMIRNVFEASRTFNNHSDQDLVEIRIYVNVPNDIKLLGPRLFQTIDHPLPGCIVIHKHSLNMGLKDPFHHCWKTLSLNMAPSNLLQMDGPSHSTLFCCGDP